MAQSKGNRVTHRVVFFDAAGKSFKMVNYRGELATVTAAAVAAAPKRAHRIDVLNDSEGTRRTGQIVRTMTRGKDGAFAVRFEPQKLVTHRKGRAVYSNPCGEVPCGNPSKNKRASASGALARASAAVRAMKDKIARVGA